MSDKPFDQIFAEQGAGHQPVLDDIANRVKENVAADEKRIFSPPAEERIDRFMVENASEIPAMLEAIHTEYKGLEGSRSPGHDYSHIMDNLNSALRIFREYGDFSQGEKLEVILSCMGHDLGRLGEPYLNEINNRNVGILMALAGGRKFLENLGLPEELRTRVMYNIQTGFVPLTGHRTADATHQCDREQLFGGLRIARNIAFEIPRFDLAAVYPKDMEPFRYSLPRFSDIPALQGSMFVPIESVARNLHDFGSPRGPLVAREQLKEGVVVFLIGLIGREKDAEIVFGPEMGFPPNDQGISKKKLPDGVYEEGKKEFESFMKTADLSDYSEESLIDLTKFVLETEHIVQPQDFVTLFRNQLVRYSEREKQNLYLMLQYALQTRHKKRVDDIQFLEAMKDDAVTEEAARWVLDELQQREHVYARDSAKYV